MEISEDRGNIHDPWKYPNFVEISTLQLAVFYIHHKIRTIRTVDYGDITVTDIRDMRKQRKIEAIKDHKTESMTINLKDVSKKYKYLIH